jgi:ATP-dependent exoDNAse (exonuclease V) beta subunit
VSTARLVYAPPLPIPPGHGGTGFGTALHRCFEVIGANAGAVAWLPAILELEASDSFVGTVAERVSAFEEWLTQTWPGATLHREWPVLVPRADGSLLSGTLDLVVRQGEYAWIIDHKSDLVTDTPEAVLQYRGQLDAYAEALTALGLRVRGLALHWVREGAVEFVRGEA